MKLNKGHAVLTPNVLLVPYSEHHVPMYHEWMQDEDLQKATASEPLTLNEEYAMQKSWREDPDKLTFIVCKAPQNVSDLAANIAIGGEDSSHAMVGDVNLFLFLDDDGENDDDMEDARKQAQPIIGEIEIMIAQKDAQGKGLGKGVLLTFLWYIMTSTDAIVNEYYGENRGGATASHLKYLRVKIDAANVRSVKLFESVDFNKVSTEPNYFGELELRRYISNTALEEIERALGSVPLVLGYG